MNVNKKKFIISILLIGLAVLIFFMLSRGTEEENISSKSAQATVEINGITIPIELADTEEKRRMGLSFRKKLDSDSGMLFMMAERNVASFWMKDMQFPLDIVWIDGEKIVNIHNNLPPEGTVPSEVYSSREPVDLVLELNGGYAESKGIKIGDTVKLNIK